MCQSGMHRRLLIAIIGCSALALILGVVVWHRHLERTRVDNRRRSDVLRVDPQKVDFGEITQGEMVAKILSVKNPSGHKVTLNVGKSCGCTSIQPRDYELGPGASTDVQVVLDATAKNGAFTEAVYVSTAEDKSSSLVVEIVGSVKRVLEIIPDRISFGELRHRSAARANIELYTLDSKTLSIRAVTTRENALVAETYQLSPNQAVVSVSLPQAAKPGPIRDIVQIAVESPFERNVEILVTGFYSGTLSAEPATLTW
jgi:hypothetical protein